MDWLRHRFSVGRFDEDGVMRMDVMNRFYYHRWTVRNVVRCVGTAATNAAAAGVAVVDNDNFDRPLLYKFVQRLPLIWLFFVHCAIDVSPDTC